jgi:FdhD protein
MLKRPDPIGISHSSIHRVEGLGGIVGQDALAIEEPLEIRLEYGPRDARVKQSISITMRTPGYDFELAAGFLFTEGILKSSTEIESIQYCGPNLLDHPTTNTVRVELSPDVKLDLKKLTRHFYTTSSCGVCGKASIEALRTESKFKILADSASIDAEIIHSLPEKLKTAQEIFDSTGGLHACALFSTQGELLLAREDVGRHNALDKLIGNAFTHHLLPLHDFILLVSGRASFELIQKASMAGIATFAAVGAPSSLAVELAKDSGMTLLGFVRNNRFNIYTNESRIRFQKGST